MFVIFQIEALHIFLLVTALDIWYFFFYLFHKISSPDFYQFAYFVYKSSYRNLSINLSALVSSFIKIKVIVSRVSRYKTASLPRVFPKNT